MKLVRPEKLNLLTNKELNEMWVQKVIADDLKLIQYDMTVGKGYLKKAKGFFETP